MFEISGLDKENPVNNIVFFKGRCDLFCNKE